MDVVKEILGRMRTVKERVRQFFFSTHIMRCVFGGVSMCQ